MLKKLTPAARRRGAVLFLLAAAFFAFLVWLNRVEKPVMTTTVGRTFERAEVVEVLQDNLEEDGRRYGEQTVLLRMLSGPKKGETVRATSSSGYLFGAGCTPGMKVIAIQSISGDITLTSVFSADRELVIYLFAGLFLLCLCLIGGWKGFKASVGLIFTLGCVVFLYLPLIFRGFSPFWAAVLVAAVTTFVTMYLIGGPSRKTACAIFGTVAGVVIAGLSASVFGAVSGVSGYNVSDIESLLFLENTTKIRVGGLLFSGLLIASLGAVMDVAMSVSSTIWEIREKRPEMTRTELFRSGMHVGRDMMGTMANTLILAFAGGSVSILVLDYAYDLPYAQIINSYGIGIEIMQGISGSLGVVLTVPIVAAAAAFVMGGSVPAPAAAAEGGAERSAPPEDVREERPGARVLLQSAARRAGPVLLRHWKGITAGVCLLVLLYCGVRFYSALTAYARGDAEYSAVRQSVSSSAPSAPPLAPAAKTEEPPKTEEVFSFDFQKLKSQNPDAAGWVRLPGTPLSYPVVQGKDNDYYLTHSFLKGESKLGCIFLDSGEKSGLSAQNPILYGHDMRNGSMFASLCLYRDESFFRQHPSLELYTEQGEAVCPVFSVHEAAPDGETYTVSFPDGAAFRNYADRMKKLSLYDTGVTPGPKDRILTLSTCVEDGRDIRFVVQAVIPVSP